MTRRGEGRSGRQNPTHGHHQRRQATARRPAEDTLALRAAKHDLATTAEIVQITEVLRAAHAVKKNRNEQNRWALLKIEAGRQAGGLIETRVKQLNPPRRFKNAGSGNHQGLGNELINGVPRPGRTGVRRRQCLGGLLNYYYRAA